MRGNDGGIAMVSLTTVLHWGSLQEGEEWLGRFKSGPKRSFEVVDLDMTLWGWG